MKMKSLFRASGWFSVANKRDKGSAKNGDGGGGNNKNNNKKSGRGKRRKDASAAASTPAKPARVLGVDGKPLPSPSDDPHNAKAAGRSRPRISRTDSSPELLDRDAIVRSASCAQAEDGLSAAEGARGKASKCSDANRRRSVAAVRHCASESDSVGAKRSGCGASRRGPDARMGVSDSFRIPTPSQRLRNAQSAHSSLVGFAAMRLDHIRKQLACDAEDEDEWGVGTGGQRQIGPSSERMRGEFRRARGIP
jgi:hypothetical protein